MRLPYRKIDIVINLAFLLGLLLGVVPDVLLYEKTDPHRLALGLLNTVLDSSLFTAVFIFLKIEIRKNRNVRERIEAIKQRQSEFLQIVAHDLRNPLNAILQLAALPPTDDDRGAIRDTAREMEDIIDSMLNMAALEKGKIQLKLTHADLAEVVGEVLNRNRPHAQRKRIELRFSAPESCLVEFDRGRIRQAVDNLVGNAIKFSPFGKPVTVTVRTVEKGVRVEVADEGPGFTTDDKARLYQRFERLSARPTGGESSVGLGLANAHDLVKLHGGQIGAESAGLGRGSLFWIELPASEA
ncbi:MAG: HAMP domain-containing sensor histidine kinase [Verrucomicrobiota bacterium]